MTRLTFFSCLLVISVSLTFSPLVRAAGKSTQAGGSPTFEKDIRPILKAHCFHCHGEAGKREGELDLRLRRLIHKGGDSGSAIQPGMPAKSLLLERVASGEMPPGKERLSAKDVATIRAWIQAGAKTARPEPKSIGSEPFITPEERAFWSFQPIRRPAVPQVKAKLRVRTPIDAFLLRKLEERGFSYNEDADRYTLIRRLTFDLHGLPPTPEQIRQYINDKKPGAYARLVDRLLASPRYGERWGRHWLDVAGYADSEGYSNTDTERKWAYKYRDYVIRSFNADKPFDQFLVEQLAGDELVKQPHKNLKPADIEKLVATGFLRMAPDGTGDRGVDQTAARNQTIADTMKIVSTSLMGLSVGCAQCHDHRYDPISQADYYRMRAIFAPAYDWKKWRTPQARLISLYTNADRNQAARIEAAAKKIDAVRLKKQAEYIERTFKKELAKLPENIRETVRTARNTPVAKRTDAQKALLRKYPSVNVSAGSLYLYDRKAANELKTIAGKAAKLRATKPKEEFVRALTEPPGHVPETKFFFRGDPKQPRQTLLPAGLSVLQPDLGSVSVEKKTVARFSIPENDKSLPTTGRRLAFARWLTSGNHPLTARVLVNRIWMHHFGTGLVNTPAEFGALGERPSHPELLDWLASEFMSPQTTTINGRKPTSWSVKSLHRLIVTSSAYRQQSRRNAKLDMLDPDNRLYGRKSIQRLDAESLRDSVLSISGKLNLKMFGPPVPVMEDAVGRFVIGKENKNGENRPGAVIPLDGNEYRRSLYIQVRRSRPLASLSTFDAPVMEPNCEKRNSSTVTPQSLMLMNDETVLARSKDFAKRLTKEKNGKLPDMISHAWLLTFGRPVSAEQREAALNFLKMQQQEIAKSNPKLSKTQTREMALASFCHALFSSNGFLYVD
ncbi:MAG: PSD1 and planctomycete cytochrome C domain-containing protein [Planctomycetaceae bacterium]